MAPNPSEQVHGEGGAYVGGYWVPIENCPEHFNIQGGSQETATPAVRSGTSHSAAKADGTYDVAIIGAGCIGAAVARELSKTHASVVVLEAADDVCQGATKGNSGIVHAGFDDTPGSVRANLCWKGNQMFPALDKDLHFGYQLTGSLVVARGEEEEKHLEELLARGATNGVANLRIVRGAELREMEPNLDAAATAALHSPDAGTLIPYEYTIALMENAADNGVEVRTRRATEDIFRDDDGLLELTLSHWEPAEYMRQQEEQAWEPSLRKRQEAEQAAEGLGNYYGGEGEGGPWEKFPELKQQKQAVSVEDMKVGGSGSMRAAGGERVTCQTVKARYVVNCAGGASDKVAKMVGDHSFDIKPRLGEYVLLKKSSGAACNHILFPCPGKYGKGVLVQKTLWGNLILGPTARDVHEWPRGADGAPADPDAKTDVLQTILQGCRRLVPDFETDDAFHSFAGARAKSTRGDWILERCAKEPNMIHAAGIDSPGIAGSPAIALEVVELLKQAGLSLEADPAFNPTRAPVIVPKQGDEGMGGVPLVYTPDDKTSVNALGVAPEQNVVCKCEKVTEAEIIDACRRSLPVDSTQAIRKRTRAGMGGCQGKPWNYGCECRVAQIVAREAELAGNALATPAVGRRPWSATSAFERRWITPEDKEVLASLAPKDAAAAALAEQGIVAPPAPEKAVDVPAGEADEAGFFEKLTGAFPLKVAQLLDVGGVVFKDGDDK